jgi:hypothetical protein
MMRSNFRSLLLTSVAPDTPLLTFLPYAARIEYDRRKIRNHCIGDILWMILAPIHDSPPTPGHSTFERLGPR